MSVSPASEPDVTDPAANPPPPASPPSLSSPPPPPPPPAPHAFSCSDVASLGTANSYVPAVVHLTMMVATALRYSPVVRAPAIRSSRVHLSSVAPVIVIVSVSSYELLRSGAIAMLIVPPTIFCPAIGKDCRPRIS